MDTITTAIEQQSQAEKYHRGNGTAEWSTGIYDSQGRKVAEIPLGGHITEHQANRQLVLSALNDRAELLAALEAYIAAEKADGAAARDYDQALQQLENNEGEDPDAHLEEMEAAYSIASQALLDAREVAIAAVAKAKGATND